MVCIAVVLDIKDQSPIEDEEADERLVPSGGGVWGGVSSWSGIGICASLRIGQEIELNRDNHFVRSTSH